MTAAQIELTGLADLTGHIQPDVFAGTDNARQTGTGSSGEPAIQIVDEGARPILATLNAAQRRAHDVVEEKLKHIVAGQ